MAPYARLEVTFTILIGAVVAIATAIFLHWWALLPAALTLALLSFYRDPRRKTPTSDDLLVAAADGRILKVERDYRSGENADPELRFVIFLSVLDAHINRSPCAGRVAHVEYRPGRFLNALRPEATARNESNLVTIQPKPPLPGPVQVRQIAGVLARRIVCTLTPGDGIAAGQRFGMIKFGSQTEIRVPDDPRWEVAVRRGDHVKAGLTVLAQFKVDQLVEPANRDHVQQASPASDNM